MPTDVALPDVVVDAVYRIARHASTLTDAWYREQLERGIDAFAYVEMVGVVVAVAAVDGFFRSAGLERPPAPRGGGAVSPTADTRRSSRPTLNWVPVAAPADRVAAVVQGLSAAPAEWDNVCGLAAAQYIPVDEMGELGVEPWHAQPRRDGVGRGASLRRRASASFERLRTR